MDTFKITLYNVDGSVNCSETYDEFELLSEAVDQFLSDHHGTLPGEKMVIEQLEG